MRFFSNTNPNVLEPSNRDALFGDTKVYFSALPVVRFLNSTLKNISYSESRKRLATFRSRLSRSARNADSLRRWKVISSTKMNSGGSYSLSLKRPGKCGAKVNPYVNHLSNDFAR